MRVMSEETLNNPNLRGVALPERSTFVSDASGRVRVVWDALLPLTAVGVMCCRFKDAGAL